MVETFLSLRTWYSSNVCISPIFLNRKIKQYWSFVHKAMNIFRQFQHFNVQVIFPILPNMHKSVASILSLAILWIFGVKNVNHYTVQWNILFCVWLFCSTIYIFTGSIEDWLVYPNSHITVFPPSSTVIFVWTKIPLLLSSVFTYLTSFASFSSFQKLTN